MGPWTALNIEPESDNEDVEYDNTKEIQIEEALKLYQIALKLHSQGPRHYDEALKAYNTLFESEIFKYPESKTALTQIIALSATDDFEDEGIVLSTEVSGENDIAPSTLPQILYLSYKNRAAFELDRFLRQPQTSEDASHVDTQTAQDTVSTTLELLSNALDKDASDPDLWRQLAALSERIGSLKLARFALESSATYQDQEDLPLLDGPDLEVLATQQQLQKLLMSIEHETSPSIESKNRSVEEHLASWIDLPGIPPSLKPRVISSAISTSELEVLTVPAKTWESVAECILAAYDRELKDGKSIFNTYTLRLVGAGEEQSVVSPISPVLVTSESLSKHRLSRGSASITAFSASESTETQTTSPVLRTKKLDSNLIENQNGVNTSNDEGISNNNGKKPNSVLTVDSKIPMKRDSDSAGLQDTPESGTRSRSKRLRARAETLADDVPDPKLLNKQHEEQLGVYSRADDWVFSVAYEIGCRFGCKWIDSAETVRDAFSAGSESMNDHEATTDPRRAALSDFKHILGAWDSNKSNLLLNGTGSGASAVLIDDGSDSSFASFMERSQADVRRSSAALPNLTNQGLIQWLQNTTEIPQDLEQLAFDWIRALLEPQQKTSAELHSLYNNSIWSSELKDALNQVMVKFDHVIYTFVSNRISDDFNDTDDSSSSIAFVAFVESIFELHIEIYSKMVAAESKTDQPSRIAQKDRLSRWATLTNCILSSQGDEEVSNKYVKELDLRHLWAQVLYIGLVEPAARDHILLCYQDLQKMLEGEKESVRILPNNSAMPEVALDALEEQLSKEKTMDFFQNIFGAESTDPVTLIENLEPVLMQTFNHSENNQLSGSTNIVSSTVPETATKESASLIPVDQDHISIGSGSDNIPLIDFIKKATVQLKLSLWHQLKGAYNRIDYPGMKVVCNFRSMILVLRELHGASYASERREDRVGNLIIWLKNLANLISQTLETIKSHAKALDCLTEENIELALEACSLVTRLFHVFALWEDSVRIGQTTQPANPGAASTYKSAMKFLREMQPKVWHLLYLIYREAYSQHHELTEAMHDDLIEFIRAIHCSFGNREYCRVDRKVLMRFMKSELLRLDGPEEEIAQALYDLYGLKITQNPNSIWEHGCIGDTIDRTSALENVEYVVSQATSMTMKDLLKSDIRIAAEKMQAVIGIPRAGASTTQQSFNRRLVTSYLKSPILASGLSQALKGLGSLSTMVIKTEYASVAKKKWFFLVGWIHLAKYRTTKRVGPDNSDDLDTAITFLKLDLDFDTSNWETWMRLAQAYDSKIDEEVLWDANMINEKADELSQLERQAIHCYEMAVSLAKQSADDTRDTQLKLSELYADLANRLYSSTREPFGGKVFDVSGHERFINQYDKGTYQVPAYQSLSVVAIWKTCEWLYQKALDEKLEDDWFIWYMRGKCRWKLSRNSSQVHWSDAVEAFIKAVQQVPEKRDSRHPEKEPVLEPHFKLLSIVHKLLKQGTILSAKGLDILKNSSYTKKLRVEDTSDWKSYVLELLQILRNADKSNWHHRMIAKGVQIAYDDETDQQTASQVAKDKFSQHILTKAMAIQIWKPEYERPGRHFVYTSRYLRFIIKLLEQLGDRPVLETLGKRVRKKQNEYIDAVDIFDQICEAHMRLVRVQGQIPEKSEERVFHQGMTFEHFTLNANRLETWAHSQLSLTNATLSLLSEVWELKKLSGTLLEKGPFEELMMDIYACLFERIVPELITRAGEAENRERMRIDRMLLDTDTNQSAQASATETTTVSSRPKQISKTEVRRRSEALVAKPPVPLVKAKTAAARENSPDSKPEAKAVAQQSKISKETVSSPASMHDDADVESELSSIADSDMEEPDIPMDLGEDSANNGLANGKQGNPKDN